MTSFYPARLFKESVSRYRHILRNRAGQNFHIGIWGRHNSAHNRSHPFYFLLLPLQPYYSWRDERFPEPRVQSIRQGIGAPGWGGGGRYASLVTGDGRHGSSAAVVQGREDELHTLEPGNPFPRHGFGVGEYIKHEMLTSVPVPRHHGLYLCVLI